MKDRILHYSPGLWGVGVEQVLGWQVTHTHKRDQTMESHIGEHNLFFFIETQAQNVLK